MSIENAIQELTEAVKANTAALLGGKIAPADVTEAPAPKAAPKAAAAKPAAKTAPAKAEAAPTATLAEALDAGLKFAGEHGREKLAEIMTAAYGSPKIRQFENEPETLAKIIKTIAAATEAAAQTDV